MNKKIITLIVTALIAGGIGFYGGTQYGKGPVATQNTFQRGIRTGSPFGNGMRAGGNALSGEILSRDEKSVTVKMRDGSSKFVFFSTSTQVMKSAEGSSSDLTMGEQITVIGTANSDGSVTAQSIQIRPEQSGLPR